MSEQTESTSEVAEIIAAEVVAPPQNVLETQERANIEVQIATARKYPRNLVDFTKKAIAIATVSDETAESCIYRRPVGKDKHGNVQFAEGMSIRMAEIVGSAYGNLRVAAQIVEMTPRYVKAQGLCHDLESNFLSVAEVIEPTIDKYGKPYSERMRIVIAKAALSKATRDATFKVVPRALAMPVEQAVRKVLYGDQKSLTKRREFASAWIAKIGIDPERVFAALGIKGIEDMTEKELVTLTGLKTAIKDGEITIDEAFPMKQEAKVGLLEKKPPEDEKKDKKDKAAKPEKNAEKPAEKPEAKSGDLL